MLELLSSGMYHTSDQARGEREGYGGPCDVTSLSLSLGEREGCGGPCDLTSPSLKSPERRPRLVIALE